MSKNEKLKLSLDIQNYFVSFFENHFSISTQSITVGDHSLTFNIVVKEKSEKFIVSYTDLFASKSELMIKSTVDILLLESIFNKLFNNETIDYNKRLIYIKDNLNQVNNQFKFFSNIELDNKPFYYFKGRVNDFDGLIYHSLLSNKRCFKLTVNQNLYSIAIRKYHFLTARFILEFNNKKQVVDYKCSLTTTSLGYSAEYEIPWGADFQKFESNFKRCKRRMVTLIAKECFNDIVINHNISLNRLKKMNEQAIKPYADLVHMSRI